MIYTTLTHGNDGGGLLVDAEDEDMAEELAIKHWFGDNEWAMRNVDVEVSDYDEDEDSWLGEPITAEDVE